MQQRKAKQVAVFKEELIAAAFHPKRLMNCLDNSEADEFSLVKAWAVADT